MKPSAEAIIGEGLEASGLDDADRKHLAEAYDHLAPEIPVIATRLEAWLISKGSSVALVPTLPQWLTSGLLGPYDATFYALRVEIGRWQLELGLPQHYFIVAINLIRDSYTDRLAVTCAPTELRSFMRAVDKLLAFELMLVLRQYAIDSEGTLVAREHAAQRERIAALQTLSAGFAHEIRNPINAATLQLELLERRIKRESTDPRFIDPLARANHELDRLTRLLDEFLAFARPHELNLATHDLVEIARRIVDRERAATEANIELVATDPADAHIDAERVRQALGNLITNAIEAVARDGHVIVTVVGDDARVIVSVVDDGPGIAASIRARIFEPFFTTKQEGTGLGMSIAHSIVTQHGGTIDIDSSPRGTRCALAFPRRQPTVASV